MRIINTCRHDNPLSAMLKGNFCDGDEEILNQVQDDECVQYNGDYLLIVGIMASSL